MGFIDSTVVSDMGLKCWNSLCAQVLEKMYDYMDESWVNVLGWDCVSPRESSLEKKSFLKNGANH